MDKTTIAIPGASSLIALGGYMATVTAVADDAKEIETRLRAVEVEQAEQGAEAVKLTNALQRLDKLEQIVSENAKQLNKLSQDIARVCEATGARCGN